MEGLAGRIAAFTAGDPFADTLIYEVDQPRRRKHSPYRSGYDRTVDDDGKPVEILGVSRDITERKTDGKCNTRGNESERNCRCALDELLQNTLDEVESLTGSQISFLHFLEPDQITLHLQMWSTNTLKNMCTAEGKGNHYEYQGGVWVDCMNGDLSSITTMQTIPTEKDFPRGTPRLSANLLCL